VETINVGIIGAGRIGRLHAENLAYRIPGAKILAVSDVIEDAAKKAASDFQIPAAYKDHRRIMDDKNIQAVIVCSSTNSHSQMIEEAALAGKDIFCEKPIDFDIAKIDHVLGVVAKTGVKLQIGFNRRFDPNFKQARDMVASGKIGEPHIVRITSRDPQPPPVEYIKVSGGLFLDMMIHDFDMARFLIGDEVSEMYSLGSVLVDPKIGEAGDIDTAIVSLTYRKGTIGTIDNSRKAVYGYDQRIEVFGSKGAVIVGNPTKDLAILNAADGIHSALPLFFFVERYTSAYIQEMTDFIDCVRNNKKPNVTGIDGRIPVLMGYAANLSNKEHRPVKLTEIDPAFK
jgi:myo-inositol 2-dehydrogenase / D-chiro-inositol 1-dehydrogenase